jgi:cytochrome bd-type quinol oxidase subunit 1
VTSITDFENIRLGRVNYLNSPILWHITCVVCWKSTSVFTVMLVPCLTYSSTVKLKATCSSETPVDFQRSIYLSIFLSIYGSTALCWALAAFSFSWYFYAVGRTPWTGISPSQGIQDSTQTQNKHRQTPMPWVGFESTIPAFEGANRVNALDRTATVW